MLWLKLFYEILRHRGNNNILIIKFDILILIFHILTAVMTDIEIMEQNLAKLLNQHSSLPQLLES
jgi:membrane-bound metal-dependent hydrolase YbcI (DUF457 family)